jgi:predicted alpha/beta hydrolase
MMHPFRTESFETRCADGVRLAGRLLIPEQAHAVVQFNGGTGAKKEFYLPFLSYLAENGYACCLWDYRGAGESAPPSLRGCSYMFRDYGLQDMPAIKSYLQGRFPGLPLYLVCHSAGGQQVGFMPDLSGIRGMVAFAVSAGYLPAMPLGYRLLSAYFFYLFTPLSIALTGYVAAKRFRIMEDLPRQVALEWRAWCRRPDYFFDPRFAGRSVPVEAYGRLPFPVQLYWTPDDTISSEANTRRFWSHVRSERGIQMQELRASAYGVREMGHFGFFRKQQRERLWPEVLETLRAM